MEADTLAEHLFPAPLIRDHFDTNELSHCWNFLYQSNSKCWSLTEIPGSLTLKGNQFNLNDEENYAWIGRCQEHMFSCIYIALYATGNGKKCQNNASYKWFDYTREED